MDTYLMMMFVSLDQERAIKKFCLENGWPFCKPDLRYMTDKIGPPTTPGPISRDMNTKLRELDTALEKDNSTTDENFSHFGEKAKEVNDEKSKAKTDVQSENIEKAVDNLELMNEIAGKPEKISENDTDVVGKLDEMNLSGVFTCKYCSCSFKYNSNLQEHMRNKRCRIETFTRDTGKSGKMNSRGTFKNCKVIPLSITQRNKPGIKTKQVDVKYAVVTVNRNPKVFRRVIKQNSQPQDVNKENPNQDNSGTGTLGGSSTFTENNSAVEMADVSDVINERVDFQETKTENEGNATLNVDKAEMKEESVFQCSHCTCTFKHRRNLQQHLRISHKKTIDKNIYPCEQCEKTFTNLVIFKKHLRLVHNETLRPPKKFVCEICGKIFHSADNLKIHRNAAHLGVRRTVISYNTNFTCEFCGKEFKRQNSLDEHLGRTHGAKDVPYHTCTICSKKYDRPSRLIRHIKREHKSSKLFECRGCKEKFLTQQTLRKHMALCQLKEDEMLQCQMCEKRFKTLYSLQLHTQIEHSKPALESACGTIIKAISSVGRHKHPQTTQYTGQLENMTSFIEGKGYSGTSTVEPVPRVDESTDNYNKEQHDASTNLEKMTTESGAPVSHMISNPTGEAQAQTGTKIVGSTQSQIGVGNDIFLDLASINPGTNLDSNVVYVIMDK